MTEPVYRTLAEVIDDELFPAVDLRLRKGHHIDDLDLDHFTFLEDARPFLEDFYNRYGCVLVRSVDAYYYLLPRGEQLGGRQLSAAAMLVGQALCLLRMDPATLQTSWRVERVRVLELLDQLVGAERLGRALNRRRGKQHSKAANEENIRKDVDGAITQLARLGFVDVDRDTLRLRASLLRFLEPVATQKHPEPAMRDLIRHGCVENGDDRQNGGLNEAREGVD